MEKEIKLKQEEFDKAMIRDEVILTDAYGNKIICKVVERIQNEPC